MLSSVELAAVCLVCRMLYTLSSISTNISAELNVCVYKLIVLVIIISWNLFYGVCFGKDMKYKYHTFSSTPAYLLHQLDPLHCDCLTSTHIDTLKLLYHKIWRGELLVISGCMQSHKINKELKYHETYKLLITNTWN